MEKYYIKQLAFVPPPYGGVSVFVKRLIDRLNKDGYTSGGYYMPDCADPQLRNSPLFDPWKWLKTSAFFSRVFSLAKEVTPYKIVHSHFSLEGMLYLWALKTFWRKKIVVTVHNSMVGNYYAQTNPVNRFFLKIMANSDVRWIAVSQQARTGMQGLPVRFKTDIEVIPAYIPAETDRPICLPKELVAFIRKYRQTIVFYGHSFMNNAGTDVYGFYDALDMFAELVKRHSVPVGLVYCISDKSDSAAIDRVRAHARELGVDSRIYWQIGALESMQPLWAKANVYIRPTSTDGDSVAIREALDMGTRVVASDVCVRPDGVVTFTFKNNSAFVERVCESLQVGRAEAQTNNSCYEEMLEIYRQLLELNRRRNG